MYRKEIQAVLRKQGLVRPTLIQKASYEAIINGASVIGLAKTGTGKTLAYALPALENVQQGHANSLIILAPTTELAVQIRRVLQPFLQGLHLTGLSLVGAGNRKRQEEKLKKKTAEVIVATPGRFFDFFSSGRIKIAQIKTLVIDEADDVLEFAKLELLRALGQNLGPGSQILLFGATASVVTAKAEALFRRRFLLIDVRPQQKSTNHHYFLQVDNAHKPAFLQELVRFKHFRGIAFFDSNRNLQHFAGIFAHTKNRFSVLSNDLSKEKRAAALRALKIGDSKLLLATDLAARGLDTAAVTYVVNYDLPDQLTTYLHRSGRTGRMNKTGFVVTLGDDHDFRNLKKMLAGHLTLKRVYFAEDHLTTVKPKGKRQRQTLKPATKRKHGKRRHKNKGYHPHFLKGKR